MYFNGVNGCMKTFDPKLSSIVDRMIMGNSISAVAKILSFEKNRGILWSVNLIITRIITLSAVQLSTRTRIHNAVLFTYAPTMPDTTIAIRQWGAMSDDNC